jgi:hypothetical protein
LLKATNVVICIDINSLYSVRVRRVKILHPHRAPVIFQGSNNH